MTTNRFEPNPDVNYGKCRNCDFTAKEHADAADHHFQTLLDSPLVYPRSGHSIAIMNPSREQRIQSFIDATCEKAIALALEGIDKAISDNDLTKEEAKEALTDNGFGNFQAAWEEREKTEESR